MNFLFRVVPLHFYLVIAYAIIVGVGSLGIGDETFSWGDKAFALPLFGENAQGEPAEVVVTWSGIVVMLAFVAQWLEAIRATAVAGTSRNDVWSLILAVISVVLFVGVPQFQTFTFFVIVIVAFGDVLLDRIIGQAVAQRDFGGMIPGGG